MSDPTVEEVREALDITERSQVELVDVGEFTKALDVVVAAARLWVDAAAPDIEAASKAVWGMQASSDLGNPKTLAEEAVAAAFGDNNLIRRAE